MMLTRLLKLLLVIVLSPMMFLGLSLPLARSWGGEWVKNTLFSEAAFAPAYLLMLLIASRFISAAEFILPGKTSALASAVFYNFITIGLMVASLVIAKFFGYSSGLYVGKKLGNLGKSLAGGATFGTAGRLGRATIGRMGKNLAESGGLRDAASQRGARGWIARQTLRAGDTASKLSFDARAVDSVKKLGLGNAQKGGYVGDIKKKAEIADRDAKLLAGKDSAGNEVSARENERVGRIKTEAEANAQKIREQAEQRKASIQTTANAEIAAQRAEEEREKDRIKKDAAIKSYSMGAAHPDQIRAEQLREEGEVRKRIEAQIKEIERRRDEEIAKAQKEIDRSKEIEISANKIQPRKRVLELADQFDDQEGKEPQSWYRFNRWRGKVTRTRNAQAAAIRKQAKSPQEKYKENLNKLLEQVEKPPEKPDEKPTA